MHCFSMHWCPLLIFTVIGISVQIIIAEQLEAVLKGPPDAAFKHGFSVGFLKALNALEKRLNVALGQISEQLKEYLERAVAAFRQNTGASEGYSPSEHNNPRSHGGFPSSNFGMQPNQQQQYAMQPHGARPNPQSPYGQSDQHQTQEGESDSYDQHGVFQSLSQQHMMQQHILKQHIMQQKHMMKSHGSEPYVPFEVQLNPQNPHGQLAQYSLQQWQSGNHQQQFSQPPSHTEVDDPPGSSFLYGAQPEPDNGSYPQAPKSHRRDRAKQKKKVRFVEDPPMTEEEEESITGLKGKNPSRGIRKQTFNF